MIWQEFKACQEAHLIEFGIQHRRMAIRALSTHLQSIWRRTAKAIPSPNMRNSKAACGRECCACPGLGCAISQPLTNIGWPVDCAMWTSTYLTGIGLSVGFDNVSVPVTKYLGANFFVVLENVVSMST